MNRFISACLVACLSLVVSGALTGCHAGVDVDPDHDHASNTSMKKTVVRDANGNVVREDVHKTNNP